MSSAFETLLSKLKRAHYLYTVESLIGWDEQVNLPPQSSDIRAEQMSLLAELGHEARSDAAIGEALTELEAQRDTLDFDQQVIVREVRKDYDRVTKLPAEFVMEKARLSSAAYHAWTKAKPANDFAGYAPYLEKHVALAQREAGYMGWGDRPYDYAIDQHDPGFSAKKIDALFSELKAGLVPLVQRINASPIKAKKSALTGFAVEAQRTFLSEVTAALGFDYGRGRIDVSPHPFCSGSGADVRMTTRFATDDPLSSLFGSIHETGHGLYEQGLSLADHATPLGQHAGMGMHESQSRMWENQVGRSRAFWQHFEPRYRELFGQELNGFSSDDLYLAINAVEPNYIRVEADEVHYNLHIILRFELEKRLISGDLAVADLPEAWGALSEELFGHRPADDRAGVLQDVHWSGGAFGYFPSYCLGNMIAAQNWATVQQAIPGLEDDFSQGDFSKLLQWLRTNVHSQGRRYPALELVERVTGEPLSPRRLLEYLEARYGALYCP
jgi:carboxypeptidase Taq